MWKHVLSELGLEYRPLLSRSNLTQANPLCTPLNWLVLVQAGACPMLGALDKGLFWGHLSAAAEQAEPCASSHVITLLRLLLTFNLQKDVDLDNQTMVPLRRLPAGIIDVLQSVVDRLSTGSKEGFRAADKDLRTLYQDLTGYSGSLRVSTTEMPVLHTSVPLRLGGVHMREVWGAEGTPRFHVIAYLPANPLQPLDDLDRATFVLLMKKPGSKSWGTFLEGGCMPVYWTLRTPELQAAMRSVGATPDLWALVERRKKELDVARTFQDTRVERWGQVCRRLAARTKPNEAPPSESVQSVTTDLDVLAVSRDKPGWCVVVRANSRPRRAAKRRARAKGGGDGEGGGEGEEDGKYEETRKIEWSTTYRAAEVPLVQLVRQDGGQKYRMWKERQLLVARSKADPKADSKADPCRAHGNIFLELLHVQEELSRRVARLLARIFRFQPPGLSRDQVTSLLDEANRRMDTVTKLKTGQIKDLFADEAAMGVPHLHRLAAYLDAIRDIAPTEIASVTTFIRDLARLSTLSRPDLDV